MPPNTAKFITPAETLCDLMASATPVNAGSNASRGASPPGVSLEISSPIIVEQPADSVSFEVSRNGHEKPQTRKKRTLQKPQTLGSRWSNSLRHRNHLPPLRWYCCCTVVVHVHVNTKARAPRGHIAVTSNPVSRVNRTVLELFSHSVTQHHHQTQLQCRSWLTHLPLRAVLSRMLALNRTEPPDSIKSTASRLRRTPHAQAVSLFLDSNQKTHRSRQQRYRLKEELAIVVGLLSAGARSSTPMSVMYLLRNPPAAGSLQSSVSAFR